MFEFLKEYFVAAVMIFCLVVGYVLKNIVKTDKINRFIPLIVAAVGIVFFLWMQNWEVTPMGVLIGAVSGLASTGLYEAFHQFLKNGIKVNTYVDEKPPSQTEQAEPILDNTTEKNVDTNDDYKNTSMGFTGNLKC